MFCNSSQFSWDGHGVCDKTLTLYIGPVPGVLSHSQGSTICGCCSLLEEVLHTFIVDLQKAGAKAQTQMQNLITECIQGHKGTH